MSSIRQDGKRPARRRRSGGWLTLVALALGMTPIADGCHSDEGVLRAKVIENRSEVVGGPVSMADVGDFLLENDQVRVAILGARDSPGPGVYGGSVVDLDRRRARMGFEGGQGRDRFAESFPVANLLVPDPEGMEVRVLSDGSDGKEASIRVEGDGEFLFEALSILRAQEMILSGIFPNPRTRMRFVTDYVLRPGARHVLVRTTLQLPDRTDQDCPEFTGCDLECPNGHAADGDGCLLCECSGVLPLDLYGAPASVFGGILGDSPLNDPQPPDPKKAGVIAGDFVFFGNQNDVFAPGPGFDEDAAVQDAYNTGRNTFQEPLIFDFVGAAGGDISYGYFTAAPPGGDPVVVNVPLFASAATAFLAGGKNCRFDPADDAACEAFRAFSYERYLVVGDGDIASVADEMYRVRGTPTGALTGHVYWATTGDPVANARVYVFADPDPAADFADVDALAEANRVARGDVGLLTAIDADVGLDLQEDGDFAAHLPPGDYRVVATDPAGVGVSRPERLRIVAGQEVELGPVLPAPATLRYAVTDDGGLGMPAKLSLVALDDAGLPLDGDGKRRVYFGDGRLGNGVRQIELTATGEGEVLVEPGRYRAVVSRGIEYSAHSEALDLFSGELSQLEATLHHEVNTTGWVSADMHLHARPSFDSGMPLDRRVLTAAAEGLDLAVSTDHDVESDYRPILRELFLEQQLAHVVGAEITTLEQGHFVGFPLAYDELVVPSHGAHDWTCESGGQILDAIRASGDKEAAPDGPLTIVAHPRDGFFGYVDQLGVDPYTMNRVPPTLEENNPVFRTASCQFDAMEIISAKRNDLIRTATVSEVVDYNRCLARLDATAGIEDLDTFCPELASGPLLPCNSGERFASCRDRNRTQLAWLTTRRILERTVAEQNANWDFSGDEADSEALCDLDELGDMPVPSGDLIKPCTFRAGQIDDWFRFLERGLLASQVASSDSHNLGKEPGYPRTYFQSETDSPSGIIIADAVATMRLARAFATYGPFVRATVSGKTFGEPITASPGSEVELALEVSTASWFGVDRIEVYMNGRLERVLLPDNPRETVEDVKSTMKLPVPDRDSWIVVIAMGLRDENLMSPVSLDVPYGEVQLSVLASRAFSLIDSAIIQSIFTIDPQVPDWSPVVPYAVTNPIYIDTDGNGFYDAPLPPPDWCSRPCNDDGDCPSGQACLDPERVCGVDIEGQCTHRRVATLHE